MVSILIRILLNAHHGFTVLNSQTEVTLQLQEKLDEFLYKNEAQSSQKLYQGNSFTTLSFFAHMNFTDDCYSFLYTVVHAADELHDKFLCFLKMVNQ